MINKIKYIPVYEDKKRSLVLLFLLIGIYAYSNTSGFSFVSSKINIYVVQPAMWILVAFIVYKMPRKSPQGKIRHKGIICMYAAVFAVILIMVQIGSGIIFGFGKAAYRQDVVSIITNFITFGTPIIGREVIRSYIIANTSKKNKIMMAVVLGVVLALVKFRISKYTSIESLQALTEFFGKYMIIYLSTSMVASYLAYIQGALPAVIYMGIIQAFELVFPKQPNPNWLVKAFIGMLIPLFALSFIKSVHEKKSNTRSKETINEKKENPISMIFTVGISVIIVWFFVGVFPIFPKAVATGSMKPDIMPGDMVIYEKLDEDTVKNLKKDDVIIFEKNALITHRIIDVKTVEGVRIFQTQGDNNSGPDPFTVDVSEIKGKLVTVIPKIGFPAVLFRKKDVDIGEYEF